MPKNILPNIKTILPLLILSLFVLSVYNLWLFIGRLEESLTISVFLSEGFPDEARINNLTMESKKIPGVKGVVFISKDKALNELLLKNPELSEEIKISGQNPLPASLEVRLRGPLQLEQVKKIANTLSRLEGIASAEYPELEITKLAELRHGFIGLALVLGILIIFSNIVIMAGQNPVTEEGEIKDQLAWLKRAASAGFINGALATAILFLLFGALLIKSPYLKFLTWWQTGGIILFSTAVPVLANLYFNKFAKRGEQTEKG